MIGKLHFGEASTWGGLLFQSALSDAFEQAPFRRH
jgi:hypothetical protein